MQTIFFYKKFPVDYINNINKQFLKDYISIEVDKHIFNLGFRFRSEPFHVSKNRDKHLIYNLDEKYYVKMSIFNNDDAVIGYFYNCYV